MIRTPNCRAIRRTLLALVITVIENGTKLWSITLTGSEVLDQDSKDAVFYQLALRYNWLETKKEKMDLFIEIEQIILPKLGIQKNASKKFN